MRKLIAASLIAVVVAGGLSDVAYAHHKEGHGGSDVGEKPGRSNPDENGNGPERDGGAADPAGEMAPHANNGCGNDSDRMDDNEGWCGRKPASTPTPGDTPPPSSTPVPPTATPPSDTPVPTDTPEPLPPVSTPEPPVKQPPVDVPENTPPSQENWKDVRTCLLPVAQPEVITVYIRVPAHAESTSATNNYDLIAMLGGLMVVGYVVRQRTS